MTDLTAHQKLWEIEQIKQLKARYLRCLDEHRWDELRGLLTDDFQMIVNLDPSGDNIYKFNSVDDFIGQVSASLEGVSHVHHGHMPEITLEGEDRASGVWAMNDYLVHPQQVTNGYGHYRERYVRGADGAWRIAHLHLTRLRLEVTPATPPATIF
jgi:hypothetical protein